jgi:D-alanine transaminase
MIAFLNGKFLELDDIKISPFDRGFLFADGVYEVLRAYNKRLFRLDDHLRRLNNSLKEVKLNPVKKNSIKKIISELIRRNDHHLKDFTIYIQITRGAYFPRMHAFPPKETGQTVFIYLNEIKSRNSQKGVKVISEKDVRWERCNVKSISLLPNILAKQKAIENDAYEALLVRNGFITEGSHSNFFCVKNNTVITPPLSNEILPGITRKVVLEICRHLKIKTSQRKVTMSELEFCTELFLTSTTSEVKPIIQIEKRKLNATGKITLRLISEFKKLVKNELTTN